jgi:flagellar basal-body rod modification protein FlgD
MAGSISNPAVSANSVVNTPVTTAGAASAGGYLSEQKDLKTPETEAKFGEVMKQIQAKYGAKPEKAREIKKTLDKDDFLKIMITQMKNQDPTKPFNADEMAAQMAQYASVEQLQNVNQNLNKMASEHQNSDRMQMTALIGKTVTVDRERFPHSENSNESLGYALSRNASEVKLTVQNEAGETVLEKDLGPQKAGDQTFSWDGKKMNTLPAKAGSYSFKIIAKDEKGATLPTDPKTQGRIIGVTFEGAEPMFLIGDAHNQQKISMKSIVKIDDVGSPLGQGQFMPQFNAQMTSAPQIGEVSAQASGEAQGGTQSAGSQVAQTADQGQPSGGKFFSFTKGQGSQNLDNSGVSPEAAAALQKYAEQKAEMEAEAAAANKPANQAQAAGNDKGFPNGLSN